MTKEERKEKRAYIKSKTKFGLAAKLCYLFFILILIGASVYAVKYVWDECKVYQSASATTRVNEAIADIEGLIDLDLKTDMIPIKIEGERVFYRIYSDVAPVADVELHKIRNVLGIVAIYEEPIVSGIVSYDLLVPDDSYAVVYEGEKELDSSVFVSQTEEGKRKAFTVPAKSTLNDMGISVPSFHWITVSNIYDISQIKIYKGTDSTDKSQELSIVPMDNNAYFAGYIRTDDFNTEMRKYAAFLSEKYSNYISNDYPYYSLRSRICSNAPLANRLLNVTLTWYGQHTSVEAVDMKVSDILMLSDNLCLFNTNFRYISNSVWGYVDDENTSLCLLLYKEWDGEWRIAELLNHIEADWLTPYLL